MTVREILIATGNPGKAAEIREILHIDDQNRPLPVRWRALSEFDRTWTEPVEDADAFAGNAEIKARHYARLSGLWTLADDSGLEVDALDGLPGVRSARFAGPDADDAANNALLLERLARVPEQQRTARFRCVAVVCDTDRVLARAEGKVEGRILPAPRGHRGFGYDPLFYYPPLGMTAAEMTPEQKHRISHRGQALRALRDSLCRILDLP